MPTAGGCPATYQEGGGDQAGEHEAGGERAPAIVAPRSVGLGDSLCAHTRQRAGGWGWEMFYLGGVAIHMVAAAR